ncbi:CCA tRNA nucleotidyltransferase, partial [Enterococcus faecium]
EYNKMLLVNQRAPRIHAFIETECYSSCPGLKEEGEALLRFAELPSVPLIEESQAWALLISQLDLIEKEIRSFLKSWKCSN